MAEETSKRLGGSIEEQRGEKRIRLDDENYLTRDEGRQIGAEPEEKDKEIDRLRQQLALRIESEETLRANHEDLVSSLAAKVECPVCFEVPKSGPIFSCVNGHLVCKDCRRDTCPTCRVPLGRSTSLLALTVIQQIPHPCQFEPQGCDARLALSNLEAHAAICPHRLVTCPNATCSLQVPLATLAEHTLERCIHKGTFLDTPLANKYNFIAKPPDSQARFDRGRNSLWQPDGLTFDGKNFFFKMTRKGRKGNWFFYVQMAGSEEDCSNYTASIQVFNLKAGIGGRNSHKFTGEVCPVDVTSTEKAAEEGFCQVLSDAQMKKVLVFRSKESDVEMADPDDREEYEKYEFGVEIDLFKAAGGPGAVNMAPLKEDAEMRPQVPSSPSISESNRGFTPMISPRQRQHRRKLVFGLGGRPARVHPNPFSSGRFREGRIAVAPHDSSDEDEGDVYAITQRNLNSSDSEGED